MAKQTASKVKIIAIVASLAALALVLSPALSLIQMPGAKKTGVDSFPADAEFIPDVTVVEQVSDEDLAACNSVNSFIHETMGARNGTVNEKSVASDKLVAEYCSRPVLIHEINGTDFKALSLVAYACDAASGRIGTVALQDSLSEHKETYCGSAKQLIVNQSNTFLATVEQFRTEYLPLLQGDQGEEQEATRGPFNDTSGSDEGSFDKSNFQEASASDGAGKEAGQSDFNATAVEATLDEVKQSLEECLALVDADQYYPAAQSFDNASKKFIALFQDEGEA